jgi:hypothetical protein
VAPGWPMMVTVHGDRGRLAVGMAGGRAVVLGASLAGLMTARVLAESYEQVSIVGKRYFKAVADVIDVPWQIATGTDLAFPGVHGRRTAKTRLINAYLPRLHAAASDPDLAAAFVRVTSLLDRPEALARPDHLMRCSSAAATPPGRRPGSARTRPSHPLRTVPREQARRPPGN